MSIASYQTGTITLNASAPNHLTNSATLGTTVTQSNSILIVSMRGGSNIVSEYNIRVQLNAGGTTVTATRLASGSAVTINYVVIESTAFNVQHIERAMSSGVNNQTISAVNTNYAFPICLGSTATGGSRSSDDLISLRITSSTNAQLEMNSSSAVTIAFQIVEMSSAEIASIQEVSTAMTSATVDVAITSVDTAKSLIFATATQGAGNIQNRQTPILSLTSGTNLRFQTALSTASTLTTYAYVVEFVNLAVTQRLTTGIAGTTTTEVLGSAPTYGGAIINGLMNRFAAANDNDDDSLEAMATATLSGSTWTFERAASTTTLDISYSVFDWADLFASGATYTLTADVGSYGITGNSTNLLFNRRLTAESGSYAVTGNAANLLRNRTLTADSGSYSVNGNAADLLYNRVLTAEAGSYSITGYAVNLVYTPISGPTYTMVAESGSYTVAGNDANLLFNRRLVADSGSYTLTGSNTGLLFHRRLDAESGSYSITGHDVVFQYFAGATYTLTADSGSYTVAGSEADLLLNRVLVAESGGYLVTGYSASLEYSGDIVYRGASSRVMLSESVYSAAAMSRPTYVFATMSQSNYSRGRLNG